MKHELTTKQMELKTKYQWNMITTKQMELKTKWNMNLLQNKWN